jgi:hypothetical protein
MNLFGRVSQNTDMPKTHNGRFEKTILGFG